MDQAVITASPRLRIIFLVVAALMLVLWGWSLIPPIENWNNPYEDGFSYVGVFYASIICLPAGLFLLTGAIAGHGRHVVRARSALFVGGGTLFIVVAFLVFQRVGDAMGWAGQTADRQRYSLAGTLRR
jgi:Na+-driven multidrug efflux pump